MTTKTQRRAQVDALFPPMSMANPTNSNLNKVLKDALITEDAGVTAVATTGAQLPAIGGYHLITSSNSAHIVVLPPLDEIGPGEEIWLEVNANGFELCSGAVGDKINNVAASVGVASAAIPATGLAICRSGTLGWYLMYLTELGAVATAIVPD
jgi:hypothetical protein